MNESDRLSEAEATVALDRKEVECLPDCPTDGAYGCAGTCPCNCHDESGTRLVVPENAQLTQEDFNLAAEEYEDTIGEPWELEYDSYLFSLLSIAQAEKAYPLGFDAGGKAQNAKVGELQEQLGLTHDAFELMLTNRNESNKKLDELREKLDIVTQRSKLMPTELERRVAEMPCPEDAHSSRLEAGESCGPCQSTGLRWPELSRRCECKGTGTYPECCSMCSGHLCKCKGSGRVPDVTLGKVIDLLIPYSEYGDRVEIVLCKSGYLVFPFAGTGGTKDEAACASLLVSAE